MSQPKRPINQDRRPRLPMAARDLVELLRDLEAAGVEVWLDGGWGVDALLGAQRREHDDVDLIPSLVEMPRLLTILERRGYALVEGELPASIVLHDAAGRQIDSTLSPSTNTGTASTGCGAARIGSTLPGALLAEDASWTSRCTVLPPEAQVLCHTGYELDEDDVRDMHALREQFGVTATPTHSGE